MRARPYRVSDYAALIGLAAESSYPYPAPGRCDALVVVESDAGEILLAAGAKPIYELYLWLGVGTPVAKFAALRLLHEHLARALEAWNVEEVNAFIPPELEVSFGRRLERSFGWVRNWPSWWRRVGKS